MLSIRRHALFKHRLIAEGCACSSCVAPHRQGYFSVWIPWSLVVKLLCTLALLQVQIKDMHTYITYM